MCLKILETKHLYHSTIASYAWDAMLLKTGIAIDLTSDKEVL